MPAGCYKLRYCLLGILFTGIVATLRSAFQALSTQVLQTNFLLSRTYFSLPPSYFLLFAQKKFVTKFVTRITNFVTCIRNFVTHVTNFVTKTFLWDRKKFVGETKILLGASKKYPAHSRIFLRGASFLLRLRCADIHTIINIYTRRGTRRTARPSLFCGFFCDFAVICCFLRR